MKLDRPIVITGFMGCGKSKIARALARRFDVSVVDLDDVITARQGRTPAQLIIEEGEPAFREIESNTLRETLKMMPTGVIALGGGAWIEETNRHLIEQRGCLSVWLDVPFEVCWGRIKASEEDRPLGRTREQALKLYNHRKPIYQLAAIHAQRMADDKLEDFIARIEQKIISHRFHG
ncbi:MAG TPA: shikimate kinase [Pyrinomonadaceae bacterium]|nr:shikimate kinase [Pyrinomonadaceae bacterium]